MHDVAALLQILGENHILRIGHIVFQMEQVAVLLLVDNLLVGESRLSLRVPVHHAQAAIDVALAIEVYEHLDDAGRTLLVHREGSAVPVARGSQAAQLLQDDAAVLVGPLPSVLEELIARQVVLLDALSGQLLHHLCFGSDGGVVGARHPAGVLAFHAGATHEDVLYGVVQHVTHVQHARHVGRRNHDRVGLTAVGLRAEKFVV